LFESYVRLDDGEDNVPLSKHLTAPAKKFANDKFASFLIKYMMDNTAEIKWRHQEREQVDQIAAARSTCYHRLLEQLLPFSDMSLPRYTKQ